MIKAEDIIRLDAELGGREGFTTDQWMAENEIDFDAIQMIAWSARLSIAEKIEEGEDTVQTFSETIANAFMLGWEAYRQYGKRKA